MKSVAVTVTMCIAFLLAACTSTEQSKIETYPSSDYASLVREYGDDEVFGPQAFRVDDDIIVVGLYGSSSCPPQPQKISINAQDQINVDMKEYKGACTADYGGPTPYQLTLPETPSLSDWVVVFDENQDSMITVHNTKD